MGPLAIVGWKNIAARGAYSSGGEVVESLKGYFIVESRETGSCRTCLFCLRDFGKYNFVVFSSNVECGVFLFIRDLCC